MTIRLIYRALRKVKFLMLQQFFTPFTKLLFHINGVSYGNNLKIIGFMKIDITRRGFLKVGDNLKIIAFIQDLDTYEVYQSEIASISRDLDPDVDGDGIPNNEDNCPSVHNFTQSDWDYDDIGDSCDSCNDIANVPGNVNIDANGTEFDPIINVIDILAFADLLDDNNLMNDCQSIDLLEDGSINQFDLVVLIDLVMSGGN